MTSDSLALLLGTYPPKMIEAMSVMGALALQLWNERV